jgi:GT2 family glycosyltransferase
MHKVAIAILNYNGCHFLKQFLPTLLQYSQEYPVFVIDNNSTDHSVEFLSNDFPEVKMIKLQQNHGFCKGYNLGLSQISAEYFILLNSDIEVTSNWIAPVIDLMEQDKTIAACQPKIKAFYDKKSFEYAGAAGGFIDKWGYPFCRGRVFNTAETDLGQYDSNIEVFWATGACLFMRASAYKELGGLDDDFFAHMEEIDLCWRLKTKGYKIFYCKDSTVYHVGGGTLPMDSPRKTYFNFRNGLYMLFKNLPEHKLWWVITVRLLLDYLTVVKFLLSGTFGKAFAIFRAHYSFFQSLKSLRKKRESQLFIRNYRKMKGVYRRSLFIDYFLLSMKTFKELDLRKF